MDHEGKPLRRALRRRGFDYSSAAFYFVTICTYHRESILGEIVNATCKPTIAGTIARECWFELPYHYGRLELDAFTIMPNHIHGVLGFVDPSWAGLRPAPTTKGGPAGGRTGLSEVIRAFKAFSGRRINEARKVRSQPVWQRGFYDRIVRNASELKQIHKYMAENPARWQFDRENSEYQNVADT